MRPRWHWCLTFKQLVPFPQAQALAAHSRSYRRCFAGENRVCTQCAASVLWRHPQGGWAHGRIDSMVDTGFLSFPCVCISSSLVAFVEETIFLIFLVDILKFGWVGLCGLFPDDNCVVYFQGLCPISLVKMELWSMHSAFTPLLCKAPISVGCFHQAVFPTLVV